MNKKEAIKELFFNDFSPLRKRVKEIEINEEMNEIKVKLEADKMTVNFEAQFFIDDVLKKMEEK